MATTRLKGCGCGRKIPADWPECGECELLSRRMFTTGEEQLNREHRRLAALLNRGWQPQVDTSDPLLTQVEEALFRLSQQKAILMEREIHRGLVAQAAVARLLWEPDEVEDL